MNPSKSYKGYKLDPKKPLGEGVYSKVYKGTGPSKEPMAFKVIPRDVYQICQEFIAREIEITKTPKSKYILKTHDVFNLENGSVCLALDFCDGGSLQNKIEKSEQGKPAISEEEGRLILKEISVAFLNTIAATGQAVMHRDIKPDNILLHKGHVKIADFGFSKMVKEKLSTEISNHTKFCGTPYYMSPQVLSDKPYSCATDIWSTGFMMYELMVGEFPWKANSVEELYEAIMENPKVAFPKYLLSYETQKLLESMLQIEEKDRPSWFQVYSHLAMKYDELKIEDLSKAALEKFKGTSK